MDHPFGRLWSPTSPRASGRQLVADGLAIRRERPALGCVVQVPGPDGPPLLSQLCEWSRARMRGRIPVSPCLA